MAVLFGGVINMITGNHVQGYHDEWLFGLSSTNGPGASAGAVIEIFKAAHTPAQHANVGIRLHANSLLQKTGIIIRIIMLQSVDGATLAPCFGKMRVV